MKYIESGKSRYFLFACIIFILCYFYDIYLSVRYVKAIQAAHPEKKGDPTSSKFTEQWVESCDEAEKMMIGRCAFEAFKVTNSVCGALSIILAISAMMFDIGFLPSFVVCLIWFVNQCV